MKRSALILVVGAVAVAGCGSGGGGGGGGTSTGPTSCAEFFSEERLCQFECGIGTGTSASTVASTLGMAQLSVGHGCVDEGGGSFSCLVACKDGPVGNETGEKDVTFYFDSTSRLNGVEGTYALPQCLSTAGCL